MYAGVGLCQMLSGPTPGPSKVRPPDPLRSDTRTWEGPASGPAGSFYFRTIVCTGTYRQLVREAVAT